MLAQRFGWVLITLAGLAGCGGGSGSSQDSEQANSQPDYLAMASGNRWTYAFSEPGISYPLERNTLVKLDGPVSIEGRQVLRQTTHFLLLGGYSFSYFKQNDGVLEQHFDGAMGVYPDSLDKWTVLRLPLVSGDAYTAYDYPHLAFPDGDDEDDLEESHATRRNVIVGNTESVTVPAGTFTNALKVIVQSHSVTTSSSGGNVVDINASSEHWYVPGIGVVKQRSTMSVTSTAEPEPFVQSTESVLTGYKVNGVSTDTTAPTITQAWPANSTTASDVTSVFVQFNEEMDPDSFSSSTFVVTDGDDQPVAGSYSGTGMYFVDGLPAGTYTAHVEGVTDALGNQLVAPYTWSFTVTGPGPGPGSGSGPGTGSCYGAAMFC